MIDNKIFLFVAPKAGQSDLPGHFDTEQLRAVRDLIYSKGLWIVEEFLRSTEPDDEMFEELLGRVRRGEASGVLKLNPAYLSDLPQIASLLDAHLEVDDCIEVYEIPERGQIVASRRQLVESSEDHRMRYTRLMHIRKAG